MARVLNVLRCLSVAPHVHSDEFGKAILLVYLADWKCSLEYGATISDAKWRKISWGPFATEVLAALLALRNAIAHKKPIDIKDDVTGHEKEIILSIKDSYGLVSPADIRKLAISTYPIVYASDQDYLDLPALSKIYLRDFEKARARATA